MARRRAGCFLHLPRDGESLPQRCYNPQPKAHRGRTFILILETKDRCWVYIYLYGGWTDMGSLRTYASAMCWLSTVECQQTPSETFCARRPHCALSPEREKQQVRALQAVAAVRSANANLGPHHSGDLPSSLENFQNYVTFKSTRKSMMKQQIFSQDVLFHSHRRIWKRSWWCQLTCTSRPVVVLSLTDAIACSSSSVLPELLWV